MMKNFTDEAIVLRIHNVGETDRFCILLTKTHGKVAARAQGVRRLVSKRGSGLLPMHKSSVTCECHSFGYVITAATCVDANSSAWKNPQAFGSAARAIELVLRLTEEGVELSDVYELLSELLSSCEENHSALLVPVFMCKLLSILGLFPSVTHSIFGDTLLAPDKVSSTTRELLGRLPTLSLSTLPKAHPSVAFELEQIAQGLLGSQLGSSLVSSPVSLALSSAVTPICQ